jgi:hypothetical protein
MYVVCFISAIHSLIKLISRIAAIFDCPYIWTFGAEPFSSVLSLIDDTLNPSYHADVFSTHAPPFSFWQRAKELVAHILSRAVKSL